MKRTLFSILVGIILFNVSGQSPFEKKQQENIKFFADEAGTQPISELKPGETIFYAQIPLNKKDFKAPFGSFWEYGEYNIIDLNADVENIGGNRYQKEDIYNETKQLDRTLKQIASDDGKMMFKFKLNDDINFDVSVDRVLKYGSGVFPLIIRIGKKKTPIGYGKLDWDLTDGGAAYAAQALAAKADYTFKYSDGVTDPAFKAAVKSDLERRLKLEIRQIAHGERVPYTRDYKSYRRNSLSITYKDLEDGKCYKAGIQAFEEGVYPNGEPYKYDGEGQLNNVEEIPCDRVDK